MPQLLFQFQRNGNSADGPILETLIHILSQRKLQYDGIQKQDDGVAVDFSDSEEAKNAFKILDGMEIMGSYLTIKPANSGTIEMNGNATHKEKHSKPGRYSRGGYKEDYTCDQDGYPEQQQQGNRPYQRRYNQRQNYGGNNYHYQQQHPPPPPKAEQYPCRILIPSDMVKVVLGKGGATITTIQNKTNTKIDVHRDKSNRNRLSEDTLTSICGDPTNFSDAIKEVLQVISTEYENRNFEDARGLQLKILAHDLLCGRIIGKGGNNLKKVRQESGVTKLIISNSIFDEGHQFGPNGMMCSSGERVITIEGTVDAICAAEKILSQRLRDYMEKDMKNSNVNATGQQGGYYNGNMMNGYNGGGYNQQQMMFPRSPYSQYGNPMGSYMNYYPYYPGYMNNHPGLLGQGYPPFPGMMASPPQGVYGEEETCCISIPTKEVGAIIGRNGGYINKVKQYSNAQVRVVKGDDDGESRVEIKGTPDAQWRASLCVFGKIKETMKVPYSEAQLKTEYLVPGSCVGRIIGKKGQVVQDIQDKAQTDIEVPKDKQGGDDVPVYITGTFNGTQVALNRIRDIVQRARSKPPTDDRNS